MQRLYSNFILSPRRLPFFYQISFIELFVNESKSHKHDYSPAHFSCHYTSGWSVFHCRDRWSFLAEHFADHSWLHSRNYPCRVGYCKKRFLIFKSKLSFSRFNGYWIFSHKKISSNPIILLKPSYISCSHLKIFTARMFR